MYYIIKKFGFIEEDKNEEQVKNFIKEDCSISSLENKNRSPIYYFGKICFYSGIAFGFIFYFIFMLLLISLKQ